MTGRMKAPDNHDFPEKCPKKSLNCARIAENTYRTDQRKSVLISADQSTVRATIKDAMAELTGAREPLFENGNTSHWVVRTKWMRFPDDVYFRIECSEGQTSVEIHSSSRLGIGDLGVNPKRILEIADYLDHAEYGNTTCEDSS